MTNEPAWLVHARALLGTREAPGAINNPTIIGWAKLLTIRVLGAIYNADSVPWCGVFVAECFRETGVDLSQMRIGVRATSWASWGVPLQVDALAPGAVLVFQRPGGGHVGFYVGEDVFAYHVLGGNQGDCVSIARIDKARCIARRWPAGQPFAPRPVQMAARAGVPLSHNEA